MTEPEGSLMAAARAEGTMRKLLDPVDIVADAIMKQPGTIPSKATVTRAHWAIDNLREAGWAIVPTVDRKALIRISNFALYLEGFGDKSTYTIYDTSGELKDDLAALGELIDALGESS